MNKHEVALVQQYAPEKIELIKRQIAPDASPDELALFLHQCYRTGLDPMSRQIYFVKRAGKPTIQVSIDGLRLVAERHGQYAGQVGPFWCGEDGVWRDVWLSKTPPLAAKVGALRSDFTEPCWGVARFDAYAQRFSGKLSAMWEKMGDVMIAKCAESLALRKAFPQELSGLYSSEEMENAQHTKSAYEARKDKDWETLVAEMAEAQTAAELQSWGQSNSSRIHNLPLEWQKHLREEFERRFAVLKGGLNVSSGHDATEALASGATIVMTGGGGSGGREPGMPRTSATPYKAMAGIATVGEIIDDEIPDPDKYLDGLDGEMAGATDMDSLNEIWAQAMEAVAVMSPPDQKAADKLYMKHRKRMGVK